MDNLGFTSPVTTVLPPRRFPKSKVSRDSPPCTREIPIRALALVWLCVVCDGTVHGEALVETTRAGA